MLQMCDVFLPLDRIPKFILLHSQNRKKESKIAVAKRQRKEKVCKDRTKKSEDQSENLR